MNSLGRLDQSDFFDDPFSAGRSFCYWVSDHGTTPASRRVETPNAQQLCNRAGFGALHLAAARKDERLDLTRESYPDPSR
jgi:hypothetical protein